MKHIFTLLFLTLSLFANLQPQITYSDQHQPLVVEYANGETITYTYDANGNLIDDGTNTYEYDSKNRLVKVATPNSTIEYSYDANDNRIAKVVNGDTTTYLIDTNTPFAQVITESKENGTEVHYTYGNDLLSDGTHTFLTDALGSTRGLVDNSEQITDSYSYTPYGTLSSHEGTSENSFLFTGEQLDSETGNYYLRARYYDPAISRFLSRDTYDGKLNDPLSQNHYLYAGGNPVMYVDPSGHCYSMGSVSNSIAVMGILAGGAITSLSIFNNNRGAHSGNIWLTVAMYNAQTWLREEYMSMIMYIEGGKQTTLSPFKDLEDEFLNMNMNDPCKKIEEYIEKMKEQVKWREGDLNPKSDSYKGHLIRIKRLNDQIKLLAGYLAMGFCRGGK